MLATLQHLVEHVGSIPVAVCAAETKPVPRRASRGRDEETSVRSLRSSESAPSRRRWTSVAGSFLTKRFVQIKGRCLRTCSHRNNGTAYVLSYRSRGVVSGDRYVRHRRPGQAMRRRHIRPCRSGEALRGRR
jgi:hypothetical protein